MNPFNGTWVADIAKSQRHPNHLFQSLSFDGNKMKATYDYPEGERIEVVLAGSFEGDAVTGTWLARESGADTEVASGTWTARRK